MANFPSLPFPIIIIANSRDPFTENLVFLDDPTFTVKTYEDQFARRSAGLFDDWKPDGGQAGKFDFSFREWDNTRQFSRSKNMAFVRNGRAAVIQYAPHGDRQTSNNIVMLRNEHERLRFLIVFTKNRRINIVRALCSRRGCCFSAFFCSFFFFFHVDPPNDFIPVPIPGARLRV